MRVMLFCVALFGALGCRTATYKEASLDMSGQLVAQLEKRRDMRRVRLYIESFSRENAERRTKVKRGRLYYDHDHSVDVRVADWFKQQLTEDMSHKVRVVNRGGSGGPAANAVLRGTFDFVEQETVLVEMEIVDLETKEVLATASGKMRNPKAD